MKHLFAYVLVAMQFFIQLAQAQLDAHQFIPPIYYGLANGGGHTGDFDRHYLVPSTPSKESVAVTVTDGAGHVILDTSLSNSSPMIHLLGRLASGADKPTSLTGTGHVIGTSKLNRPVPDGLIIFASAPIYANIRHQTGFHREHR